MLNEEIVTYKFAWISLKNRNLFVIISIDICSIIHASAAPLERKCSINQTFTWFIYVYVLIDIERYRTLQNIAEERKIIISKLISSLIL